MTHTPAQSLNGISTLLSLLYTPLGFRIGPMLRPVEAASPACVAFAPPRVAFVVEQTLGHVTHARNLRSALSERSDITPTWLPIPFETRGPLRLVPGVGGNWSFRASLQARASLGRELARKPHQALVFHTQVTALFSLDLMRRIPTVVSLDATPLNFDSVGPHYHHRPAGNGLVDRQKFALNRSVFHTAYALVTWSEWARQSLMDDYGVPSSRICVLAPGASRKYFEIGERRKRTSLPEAVSCAKDRPVRLLFVGNDFVRKGGPLLLDYVTRTGGARCELDLVTSAEVGSVPAGVRVYSGLEPNGPALRQLFARADVFVLPTLADCLAVVLMEAAAAGLPVVTTTVGAVPEAVLPGQSGFLVPAGDEKALGETLSLLVEDRDLRVRMGRAGLALAREKFDADRNNAALLDLVLEAAGASGPWRRAA